MKKIFELISKHSLPAILTAFTGVTLVTSSSGIIRAVGNINGFKKEVPEIKTVLEAQKEEITPSLSPSPSPSVRPQGSRDESVETRKKAVTSPTPTSVTPTPVNSINLSTGVNTGIKPSVSVRGGDDDSRDDSKEVKTINHSENNIVIDNEIEN